MVAVRVLQQLQIGLDVGVGGVLGLRLVQQFIGALIVAAQHVGEAFVVEHFDGRADQADDLRIGAVGEIEAVQPVVGGGEPDPGFGVVGVLLDGALEVVFGHREIVAAEIFLAELDVVVGIVAEKAGLRQRRDRLAARPRFGRLGDDRTGGVAGCPWRAAGKRARGGAVGGRSVEARRVVEFFPARAAGQARAQADETRRHKDQDPPCSDTHTHAPKRPVSGTPQSTRIAPSRHGPRRGNTKADGAGQGRLGDQG